MASAKYKAVGRRSNLRRKDPTLIQYGARINEERKGGSVHRGWCLRDSLSCLRLGLEGRGSTFGARSARLSKPPLASAERVVPLVKSRWPTFQTHVGPSERRRAS